MDLSKAFDTIDHILLKAKLNAYGFSKSALRLIKRYLKNRWQGTKINTSFSSWTELLLGVPQGSVLGTILFISTLMIYFGLTKRLHVVFFIRNLFIRNLHVESSKINKLLVLNCYD